MIAKGDFIFIPQIAHLVVEKMNFRRGIYRVMYGERFDNNVIVGDTYYPAIRVPALGISIGRTSTGWASSVPDLFVPIDGEAQISMQFTNTANLGWMSFERVGDF